MRVVHVNTADRKGGAGIAAYLIHSGLRTFSGVDSRILAGIKVTKDTCVQPCYGSNTGYLLSRLNHRILIKLGFGGALQLPPAFNANRLLRSADIIHLHHIHGGFFSYRALLQMARSMPMVWTLHDMWSFTGYCAYANDCSRWLNGCGSCPQLASPGTTPDFSKWHWKKKKKACQNARLTIVTPSSWMANLAKQSPIHGNLDVHCIPNGIDTDIFRPREKELLRRALDLPKDAKVLLALSESRKGSERLPRILGALDKNIRQALYLILVGDVIPEDLIQLLGIGRVQATGYVATPERMAALYGMADLFLLPTDADNLPNTLIESISCGTPAVTFNVGGCPDIIRHMGTGYLARVKDDDDFAEGIKYLLQNQQLRASLCENCRQLAKNEFSVNAAVARYFALYQSLMKNIKK